MLYISLIFFSFVFNIFFCFASDMNVSQLNVDDKSNQNNAPVVVNIAPKSATLVSLHSDRPKVMRQIHHLFVNYF